MYCFLAMSYSKYKIMAIVCCPFSFYMFMQGLQSHWATAFIMPPVQKPTMVVAKIKRRKLQPFRYIGLQDKEQTVILLNAEP